jgi:hypothetical protein
MAPDGRPPSDFKPPPPTPTPHWSRLCFLLRPIKRTVRALARVAASIPISCLAVFYITRRRRLAFVRRRFVVLEPSPPTGASTTIAGSAPDPQDQDARPLLAVVRSALQQLQSRFTGARAVRRAPLLAFGAFAGQELPEAKLKPHAQSPTAAPRRRSPEHRHQKPPEQNRPSRRHHKNHDVKLELHRCPSSAPRPPASLPEPSAITMSARPLFRPPVVVHYW